MGVQRELAYLRELEDLYGSHYIRKYFGFSLAGIASRVGINPKLFRAAIRGRRLFPKKHVTKLIEVFKEMDIESKTKDFKPSNSQLWLRSAWEKIRLDKMLIFAILITMMINSSFLNPLKVSYREYIVELCQNSRQIVRFFNRAFDFLLNAFFVFSTQKIKDFLQKATSFYEVAFLF